jgi:hypothetical protein
MACAVIDVQCRDSGRASLDHRDESGDASLKGKEWARSNLASRQAYSPVFAGDYARSPAVDGWSGSD